MRTRSQRGVSSVAVHAGLLVAALGAAYFTWTRDHTQVATTEMVAVMDVAKRDVDSVVYEEQGGRKVVLERKTPDSGESYAWLTVTAKQRNVAPGPPRGLPPSHPPLPKPGSGLPGSGPMGAHGMGAPPPPPGMGKAPPPPPPSNKGGDKAAADKDKPAAPAPVAAKPPAAPTPVAAKPAVPGAPAPGAPVPGAPAPAPAAAADPDAGVPPALAHPTVEDKMVVREFRGNEAAERMLEAFSPLQALRTLGKLDDAKAKELGLTESKKTLTVMVKGAPRKLVIGGTAYGTADVYVRDEQGDVYLLPQRFSSDFEFAESRLMERRLHRFEREQISKVVVTVGNKTRVLLQQQRTDPMKFYWTAQDAPADKRDETLRNWMDKVLRLALTDYVPKGEEPKGPAMSESGTGAPQSGEVMTLKFYEKDKEIGNAVFSRYPNGTASDYYGRTETTLGLVRLLQATAENVIQDAEKW